jgi:hypothetical protein
LPCGAAVEELGEARPSRLRLAPEKRPRHAEGRRKPRGRGVKGPGGRRLKAKYVKGGGASALSASACVRECGRRRRAGLLLT